MQVKFTKEYVDSKVSSVGATNGLTEFSPGFIGLGGTLSQITQIDGSDYDILLTGFSNILFTSSVFDVESDFVVGIVWGIKGALKYILHRTKAKMGFGDSTKAIRKHRELYPKIERTVIEDKANGSPLIEILKKEVSGIIPYNPQVSKTERARLSEPDFEAKQVLLPVKDIATFDVDDFMHNLMAFPNAKNDDDVDATTCGIIYSKALFRKFNIY